MRVEHPLLLEDLNAIARDEAIPWERLRGKTALVTGVTGLLGGLLAKSLLLASELRGLNLTVLAQARDRERAEAALGKAGQGLEYVMGDIRKPLAVPGAVDFCLHAAAPTASRFFVQQPVETIVDVYQGTANLLALARDKGAEAILYISSMEVYGRLDHVEAREDDAGALDPLAVRSSYPQAKRLAETFCAAYAREYCLPVKIARPTLVFGPGVRPDDNRVFMQFARAALTRGEICLATSGATERDYIYTADACRLLLAILLKGEACQAYNVANPNTYMSILELAKAFQTARPSTTVKINAGDAGRYASETHVRLNVDRAKALDDFAMLGMDGMIERLLGWVELYNV